MKRRHVLSAIGSSPALVLAGCLGSTVPGGEGHTTTAAGSAPRTDPSPTSGPARSIAVTDSFVPDDAALEPHVTVSNGRGRSDPPAIDVELESTVDQVALFGPYEPLGWPTAEREDDDGQLLLIPENIAADGTRYYAPGDGDGDEFVPDERRDDCWTAGFDVGVVRQLAIERELSEGESVSNTYYTLNHPDNANCFPAGRYRTEDTVLLDGDEYDWGFEITVKE